MTGASPGGARVILRLILVLQVALGCALVLVDLTRSGGAEGFPATLPASLPFLPGIRPPALDAPVAPGDQRRRFVPSDLQVLPNAGEMPSRLAYERDGDTLRLTGQIAPGDAERFAEWLAADGTGAARVTLHSTGGSVVDAVDIGRAVRKAGLDVVVPAERLCLSACPYILAGGVSRTVGAGAAVGVHQHFHGQNAYLPAFLAIEDIQSGQSEVMAHLVDMGIDPRVMIPAMATPPAEIYVLVRGELEEFGFVKPSEEE